MVQPEKCLRKKGLMCPISLNHYKFDNRERNHIYIVFNAQCIDPDSYIENISKF
jgi:hypothetical protein